MPEAEIEAHQTIPESGKSRGCGSQEESAFQGDLTAESPHENIRSAFLTLRRDRAEALTSIFSPAVLALALPYSLIHGVCYDRGVQPLKLHFKTTLLVSAITLVVMIALLLVISARLVDFIRADEKALTEVGAVSLAEHLGQSPSLSDPSELERATALARAARRDAIGVRVWQAAGDGFKVVWSSSGGQAATEMPAGVADSLSRQQIARIESGRVIETGV